MLARGRPLDAREHARAILSRIPDSPVGLALWADAAELSWLDHEVVEALEALARAVPWRADVWLRLGRAGLAVGYAGAREALERAASAPEEREASRKALLMLADLDLAAADPARARQWLERMPTGGLSGAPRDEAVLLRKAECALAMGSLQEARELASEISDPLGEPISDAVKADEREPGRRALLFARVARATGDPVTAGAAAIGFATRAFILDQPGARELFAEILSTTTDAKVLSEARAIVAGAGAYEDPRFVAAFAFAQGRREDALRALVRAVKAGDPLAAGPLARLAIETRDRAALEVVQEAAPAALTTGARRFLAALRAVERGEGGEALEALDGVDEPELAAWAESLSRDAYALSLGGERAHWPALLDALVVAARELGSGADLMRIEALSAELDRPVLVAIVGEFNAGKSTFINAFLGVDVAPTGILPTTATLHRVAWAADRFARVLLRGAPDRVVPHEALKSTLAELQKEGAHIERVQIYAPIERLRWVEILDTPGFNAPDPEHAKAAMGAFDEAHAVVWLLDLTAPLKKSEAEILKHVAEAGLPIVVLCNKLDRMTEQADVERVLAHVKAGLDEIGIRPIAGPLAFSAKLALAGRMGSEADLQRSGWAAIQDELSRTLVDRADVLREHALRRRAAKIALALAEVATARTRAQSEQNDALARTAAHLLAASARLHERLEETVVAVRAEVQPAIAELAADLKPLAQLKADRAETALTGYPQLRAVARLAIPVTRAVGRMVAAGDPDLARVLVSIAIEASAGGLGADGTVDEATIHAVLRSAVKAYAQALKLEAKTRGAAVRGAGAERRLSALARALSGDQNGAQR